MQEEMRSTLCQTTNSGSYHISLGKFTGCQAFLFVLLSHLKASQLHTVALIDCACPSLSFRVE